MVEDDNKRKPTNGQSSQPDLLKLPAGLDSPDPVGGNPFPDGDPRQRVWQDATRRAEQEVQQANVAYLKMLTEPPESEAPNEKRLLTLARYGYLIIAKFDAWSFRGLHVVWSDADLEAFDQWLADYGNSWLVSMKGLLPSGTEADWVLGKLREALIGRIEHWKAEARKYVTANKEHRAALPMPENMVRPRVVGWEEVEITFLSDERVQIVAGTIRETLNYAELGFEDGRSHKPNLAWQSLRVLAENRGIIAEATGRQRSWPTVEKRMQEIRRKLCDYFGLKIDPVPFISGVGYKARFKISASPSINT